MVEPWRPTENHDTQRYWSACARRELVIARCEDCGFWLHPPKGVCPKCWSDRISHQTVSGQARVYSFVVLPAARQEPGSPDKVTVWGELVEQSRLLVIGDLHPDDDAHLSIGDPLELSWIDWKGFSVPGFRKRST